MPPDDTPLDDRLPSTVQREWTETADLLRGHCNRLAKRDLSAEDLNNLAQAAVAAQILDCQARLMDSALDQKRHKLDRGY